MKQGGHLISPLIPTPVIYVQPQPVNSEAMTEVEIKINAH